MFVDKYIDFTLDSKVVTFGAQKISSKSTVPLRRETCRCPTATTIAKSSSSRSPRHAFNSSLSRPTCPLRRAISFHKNIASVSGRRSTLKLRRNLHHLLTVFDNECILYIPEFCRIESKTGKNLSLSKLDRRTKF